MKRFKETIAQLGLTHVPQQCDDTFTEQDLIYFDFSINALMKWKPYLSKGRNHLLYLGKSILVARALWNFWHPKDPLHSTDVVLHKNNNTNDETLENIIKITAIEHARSCTQAQKQKNKQASASACWYCCIINGRNPLCLYLCDYCVLLLSMYVLYKWRSGLKKS